MALDNSYNEYQTQLNEDILNSLEPEEREKLEIYLDIPFIRNLIKADRKRARDLPRDESGKIIVDICEPHILEDMDYFREMAITYEQTEAYTNLKPNANKNSEFALLLKRELHRILGGMVRPSDGEWIPGELYYYLNYSPISLTKLRPNSKQADRVIGFPEVWEGTYLWYHYLHQGRYGGKYYPEGGKQGVMIARRGAGKAHPYSQKVITPEGIKSWGDINVGSKLYGDDGKVTTVIDVPYDEESDIYTLTLKDGRKIDTTLGHLWKVLKKGKEYIVSTEELLKIFRNHHKISGHILFGKEYKISIPVNSAVEFPYQPIEVDPYTMGILLGNGCFRTYPIHNEVIFTCRQEDLDIYKKYIPYSINKATTDKYTYNIHISQIGTILQNYGLNFKKSEDKFIPDEYKYNSKEVRLAVLRGLMDIDGTVSNGRNCEFNTSSLQLSEDVMFICRSLGMNCTVEKKKTGYRKDGVYNPCLPIYTVRIYGDEDIFLLPGKLSLLRKKTANYSKSKMFCSRIVDIQYSHRERAKCVTIDNSSQCYLIGDFVVTHNSYSIASILAKLFVVGDNKEAYEKVTGILTAYEKEYLIKDGTLNKFVNMIDFAADKIPFFPSARFKDSFAEMDWIMGYKDADTDVIRGSRNEILGFSSKDNPDKGRGKRAAKLIYEEFGNFPKFVNTWNINKESIKEGEYSFGQQIAIGCVCAGSKTWNKYGEYTTIENITEESGIVGYKNKKANVEPVTYIQPYTEKECVRVTHSYGDIECSIDHPILCKVPIRNKENNFRGTEVRFVEAQNIKRSYYIAQIDEVDVWGNDTLFDPYAVGTLKNNKRLPANYKTLTKDDSIQLISGLFDTWGSIHKSKITIIQSSYEIQEQIASILRKLGIFCTIRKKRSLKFSTCSNRDSSSFMYLMEIADKQSIINFKKYIPLKIKYKRDALANINLTSSIEDNIRWRPVKSVVPIGIKQVFNITANDSHTYIANGIITHNTGGSENADFSGALELIYHPDGYDIYGLPNVFDDNAKLNSKTVFFFGSYLNRKGYYNKDGVSDVIGALLSELKLRTVIKYNSSDPMTITQHIAEHAITIKEAVLKRDNTLYPVADLSERINQLDTDISIKNSLLAGIPKIKDTQAIFAMDPNIECLWEFPHKDNKHIGGAFMYKRPEKDSSGNVYSGRYIAGCLPSGEKVNTEEGLIPIETVTLSNKLISKDGKYDNIINLQEYDVIDEDIYTIKMCNILDTTTFTEEHPIYCKSEDDFIFKKVKDVKRGDIVKVPNIYNSLYNKFYIPNYIISLYKLPFNFDFWNAVGYMIGDNSSTNIYWVYYTHNKEFMNFMKNEFKIDDPHPTIPEWVKFLPNSYKVTLINAYLQSNAVVEDKYIYTTSIYKNIICGIQDILFSLGIVSEVTSKDDYYVLCIRNNEVYKFVQNYWGCEKIKNIRKNFDEDSLECFLSEDLQYIYIQVEEVTKSKYTGKVYNFECESHTFMCNYITTHNCDTYDDDASETLSLGAFYILDLYTDELVFEYVGRPMFADEFYEICRAGTMLYKAECNYENDKKGLFKYFSQYNSLYLLSQTLDFLKEKQLMKEGLYGNKAYGTKATAPIKAYGRRCLKDWLLKPRTITNIVVNDGIPTEQEITTKNLYTIPFKPLLQELMMWNSDGNFDRHDAMVMLMLLREDKLRRLGPNGYKVETKNSSELSEDPFFTRNYRKL